MLTVLQTFVIFKLCNAYKAVKQLGKSKLVN